ncbi:Hypothetical Protein FCC1311_085112 [Hondaea fermentalgiana]|uniref:Uncharacterized protein n=1 Tax=Hondaea fermentalgiana TaxID=2315210 RepID=A0A2R5GN20_9STRA|nr:Hypothetical Protein FCC1311_085112 [Hondaea fermentalgiana]|eukprot:GBG32286.1 Hypothetical Protein FCC1311_085112 [Hondaea fermentalgiana]
MVTTRQQAAAPAESERKRQTGVMHPRVWSVAVVLFAALVFSVLSVGESETSNKIAADVEAKSQEFANAAADTKDAAVDKITQAYQDALASVDSGSESWRAKYDRAYDATREQLENANLVKRREETVTDKLRNAYNDMESRVEQARKKYLDSYDSSVSSSVKELRAQMKSTAEDIRKQYNDGKISLAEAEKQMQAKAKEAHDSMSKSLDSSDAKSSLDKAYREMHKELRSAHSDYVSVYDTVYESVANAGNSAWDTAAGAADAAKRAADGAADTIRDIPNTASTVGDKVYHKAQEARYAATGDSATDEAKRMYHKAKAASDDAILEGHKTKRDAKDQGRGIMNSAADAVRGVGTTCSNAANGVRTQFDVAYHTATDYLSNVYDSAVQSTK